MDDEIDTQLRLMRSAETRALWDGRIAYANLLRRLYLMSACHFRGAPVDTCDY